MKLFLKNKPLTLILLLLISFGRLWAQDIPEPMSPPRLVNDLAGVFSDIQRQALENKLLSYHDSTSTQIYVVTVSDLGGYAVSDYTFKLGEEWGIGQKSKDNGAVILIKPKVGNSRGQAFIATGYGLEALINDAFAGRIVRNDMIPYFINEDYFGGVNAAIDVMVARLAGEFDADEAETEGVPWVAIFIIIFFIIIFVIMISGGGDQHIDGKGGNRGNRGTVFFPPIIGGGLFGGGGRGGFGGGGFGGFGGGGGGSFGGGGAGGSW